MYNGQLPGPDRTVLIRDIMRKWIQEGLLEWHGVLAALLRPVVRQDLYAAGFK